MPKINNKIEKILIWQVLQQFQKVKKKKERKNKILQNLNKFFFLIFS
jgi:hypothetical protein